MPQRILASLPTTQQMVDQQSVWCILTGGPSWSWTLRAFSTCPKRRGEERWRVRATSGFFGFWDGATVARARLPIDTLWLAVVKFSVRESAFIRPSCSKHVLHPRANGPRRTASRPTVEHLSNKVNKANKVSTGHMLFSSGQWWFQSTMLLIASSTFKVAMTKMAGLGNIKFLS